MPSLSSKELESRGPTVDAAVAAGLLRMGLERSDVNVIIIDEGSRGLLGIGSREAIVRLIANPAPVASETATPSATPPPAARPKEKPAPVAKPAAEPKLKASAHKPESESTSVETDEELDTEREAAIEIIAELLAKMHVAAEVSGYLTEPDDLTKQRVNIIDIEGEDLGVLIGPRGETLDSLQFLGRLMVAHKLHRRANFVVDVQGFRKRREQALTRLAERMAEKARQRGEAITLEPMSAYERRIIHMTLRDADAVYTESTGEGKQRRVRIIPKR